MDNITNLKRKAQKFVQRGDYPQAIELYADIVSEGPADPYDFVVLGDLLLRDSQAEMAVERYQEAVGAYITNGLNRNAIALCKRIRRLSPRKVEIQRQLGDLYVREGLNTEATLHYLEYLESAKDQEGFADSAEAICETLLGFRLPSFDLVPRIVGVARQVNQAAPLARLVFQQFQWAQAEGHTKAAGMLLQEAQTLDPDIENNEAHVAIDLGAMEIEDNSSSFRLPESRADIGFDDPSAVDLERPQNIEPPQVDLEPEVASQGLELVPQTEEKEIPAEADVVEESRSSSSILCPQDPQSGVFDLDSAVIDDEIEEEAPEPTSEYDPAKLLQRAHRSLERGEKVLAQRDYMRAGLAFLENDELAEAGSVFAQVIRLDPNHVEALQALVRVTSVDEDPGRWIGYACDLGDVFLARELYREALAQFEAVLGIDPDHAKAKSRVVRLRSMDQSEASTEAPVGEGGEVTIRDDAGQPTQTENDLAAILDEFRSSIVEAIPDDDAQSHYDMGMAYRDMELLEEAVQEFHLSMTDEAIRPRALEMMADCYSAQGRHEDSLNLLEEVLAYAEDPTVEARVHLSIGKSYLSCNRTEEAQEALHKALEANGDLMEAAELLQELELRRSEQ